MIAEETVQHIGTVLSLKGNDLAEVALSDKSDCEECSAARFCHAGGAGKSVMTVRVPSGLRLKAGDRVIVRGTEAIHRRAIMLATVVPCAALIAVMVLIYCLTLNQGLAAMSGLMAMALFFLLLYIFRGRLAREMQFSVSERADSEDLQKRIE